IRRRLSGPCFCAGGSSMSPANGTCPASNALPGAESRPDLFLRQAAPRRGAGDLLSETTMSEAAQSEVQNFIRETVTGHPVVLFMKGTAQFPQCGFSGRAIQILKETGVTKLVTVNVLEDPEVRQGIKDYANWPTIPQLYVKGEFIGGTDIMNEMHQNGELTQLLKDAGAIE